MACALAGPSAALWAAALAAFFLGALVQAAIACVLYFSPRSLRPSLGLALAIAASAAPFALRPSLPADLPPVVWFVLASVGMNAFFKSLQAAHGLFPCGAAPLARFVGCFLAVPQERWAKGKQLRCSASELAAHLRGFAGHMLAMSLVLSLVLSAPDLFPFGGASPLARLGGNMAHLWSLYLFLVLLADTGRLLTMLQGVSPEEAFLSPLLSSRSFKEAWGERWNLLVHSYLKSIVYKPLRRRGASATAATLASFVASGLLHEYMFALHNARAYSFGPVSLFFILMGMIMLAEQQLAPRVVPASLAWLWAKLPTPIVATTLAALSCVPFERLYMRSWRESGMLPSMGQLVPLVRCEL